MLKTRLPSCLLFIVLCLASQAFATEPLWSDDFRTLDHWDLRLVGHADDEPVPSGPHWTLSDHWLRPTRFTSRKPVQGLFDVALAKTDIPTDCTIRCKVRRTSKPGGYGIFLRAKDPSNCVVAWVTTLETIEIRQLSDGKERVLASAFGYLPSGESNLEVQAYGPPCHGRA